MSKAEKKIGWNPCEGCPDKHPKGGCNNYYTECAEMKRKAEKELAKKNRIIEKLKGMILKSMRGDIQCSPEIEASYRAQIEKELRGGE